MSIRYKKFLLKYWPILTIILLEFILFFANYIPGTFLIGWDNLYPELNFSLNIKRSLFSVWQHYRSLGYVDGMSHAANLFHDIFRLMISWFVPLNMVRWVFIFLMHLIGGVGMYILLANYVFKYLGTKTDIQENEKSNLTKIIALFGGLFYQYNLITVQQFFLPFELFLVHFAFLPWLIFYCLQFLRNGEKKDLTLFALFSFFSIPQAHVPTIFIVYIMALALVFISQLFISKGKDFNKIVLLTLVTILINSYWGIPFAYSTLNNANTIANSKNNQMATDDIFYRNLKFGDFSSVALMKGVVLDYWQYDIKGQASHYMMHPWLDHIETGIFKIPAWTFFVITLFGFIVMVLKKNKLSIPFLILFLFSFSMMANDTPGISFVYEFFRRFIPLFHNIFRFVFTKFSFLYAFSYTIFLTIGIYYITYYLGFLINFFAHQRHTNTHNFTNLFHVRKDLLIHNSIVKTITLIVLFILLLFYSFPSFQKHFFYENLATQMPVEYAQTFNFFSSQPTNERVAILPIPWYWAWTQNNWNTIGSGFTWYGISQPTTDRAFDPWSDKNENLYWELDQAIYSEDITQLESVFDKYDLTWVFFDKSVHNGSAAKFDFSRYTSLLATSPRFQLIQQFGFIDIYRFTPKKELNNFVSLRNDLPTVAPPYQNDNFDEAYQDIGDYVSTKPAANTIFYPFRSLFSGKKASNEEFVVADEGQNSLSFQVHLDLTMKGKTLNTPTIYNEEFTVTDLQEPSISTNSSVLITLDDKVLLKTNDITRLRVKQIKLPEFKKGILKITLKKSEISLYDNERDYNFSQLVNDGCWKNTEETASMTHENGGLTFISQKSNNCVNINLLTISQRYGYMIQLDTLNSPIKGLFFSAINSMTKKTDLETYLDHDGKEHSYYFVLSPRNRYGLGYTLNFNNTSFGREKVINRLKKITVYQIPFYFLKELTIGDVENTILKEETYPLRVEENHYFIYSATSDKKNLIKNPMIYLSQAYDKGWTAYIVKNNSFMSKYFPFISGKKLTEHVVVNNWANGWRIPMDLKGESDKVFITMIFWPQYLLFFGLLLTASTAGVIYFYKERK